MRKWFGICDAHTKLVGFWPGSVRKKIWLVILVLKRTSRWHRSFKWLSWSFNLQKSFTLRAHRGTKLYIIIFYKKFVRLFSSPALKINSCLFAFSSILAQKVDIVISLSRNQITGNFVLYKKLFYTFSPSLIVLEL